MTHVKTNFVGLGLAAAIGLMAIPTAAHADWRDGRGERHGEGWHGDGGQGGEWHHRREWRGPAFYVAPGEYYPPPQVYYAPPPVYYAPPPVYYPPPGITIGLGLRLR